jgi:hypothetical protein
MFGPRITTVFASRWKALWWSAGILLTAYCSVPSPDNSDKPGDKGMKTHHAHVDPWAATPGQGQSHPKS